MNIEHLNTIWPEWRVVEQIGAGAFGKVYKVIRESRGITDYAAVKVISIPQNDAEIRALKAEGYDEISTKSHFEGIVNDFINEIKIMISMKGSSNIVSIEDYKVIERNEEIGWDIFIKMELLTCLNEYIAGRKLEESEVTKLGQDICTALEICSRNNIIHRDIKPENLFLSPLGDFKIGDFGIARKLEQTNTSMSSAGALNYMAPEVIKLNKYDETVDIYSLGLVLYKLLNNNRLPFLDPYAQLIQYKERKDAVDRRLYGEEFPSPAQASPQMTQVILKACAFDSQNRFQNASDMRAALEAVKTGSYVAESVTPNGKSSLQHTQQKQENNSEKEVYKPRKRKALIVVAVVAFIAIVGVLALYGWITTINDPVDKLETAIRENDFIVAAQIYRDELRYGDSGKRAEAEEFTINHAESIKTSYISSEIDYEETLTQLQELEKLKIVSEEIFATMIDEINEMRISRTSYNNALQRMESGDYQYAINEFRKVIQVDENYTDAQMQLVNAIKFYKEQIFSEVSSLETSNQYDDAISVVNAALLVVPNDADFTTRIADIEQKIADSIALAIEGIISDAKAKVSASGDYTTAITNLRALSKKYADSAELQNAISALEDDFVVIMLDEAAFLASNSEYENAVSLLREALVLAQNNSLVLSTITDYEAKFPVRLSDLTWFTKG